MIEKIGLICIGIAVGTLVSLAAGNKFWAPLIVVAGLLWLVMLLVLSLLEAIATGKNPFKMRGK